MFSIKYFFSKCDQILSFLRIWLHLLKKSLMENFIFVQCMYDLHKSYLFLRKLSSAKMPSDGIIYFSYLGRDIFSYVGLLSVYSVYGGV